MIKIDGVKVKTGQIIYLPEYWHEQVEGKVGKKDIPYQFSVKETKTRKTMRLLYQKPS